LPATRAMRRVIDALRRGDYAAGVMMIHDVEDGR
jgi:hypothetical protein